MITGIFISLSEFGLQYLEDKLDIKTVKMQGFNEKSTEAPYYSGG